MKASWHSAIFAGVIGMQGVIFGATAAPVVPPEIRLLESARTFAVEVEQQYGGAEVELPFESVMTELLQFGGLTKAGKDEADLIVRVQAEGNALSREYRNFVSDDKVTHYSGANLRGSVELTGKSGRHARLEFSGHVEPPLNLYQPYEEPGEAPFARAFGGFIDRVMPWVAMGRGPAVLGKVLSPEAGEALFNEAPQALVAAAETLAQLAPPDALATLKTALGSDSDARRAAGARGLAALLPRQRAAGSAVLDDLVSLLIAGGDELDEKEYPGRWAVVVSLDAATDSQELEDGTLAVRPEVLRALRAIPASPEKRAALLAALGDKEFTMRRIGAALLLGWDRDQEAVEPLIAVLASDPEDLVQAAAANALGAIKDRRAVDVLLKVGVQEDETEAKFASLRALEEIAPEKVPPNKKEDEKP